MKFGLVILLVACVVQTPGGGGGTPSACPEPYAIVYYAEWTSYAQTDPIPGGGTHGTAGETLRWKFDDADGVSNTTNLTGGVDCEWGEVAVSPPAGQDWGVGAGMARLLDGAGVEKDARNFKIWGPDP